MNHEKTRSMLAAAAVFALGFLLHNGDHARRGLSVLTPEVLLAGTAGAILSIAAVVLVALGHQYAPQVAGVCALHRKGEGVALAYTVLPSVS